MKNSVRVLYDAKMAKLSSESITENDDDTYVVTKGSITQNGMNNNTMIPSQKRFIFRLISQFSLFLGWLHVFVLRIISNLVHCSF